MLPPTSNATANALTIMELPKSPIDVDLYALALKAASIIMINAITKIYSAINNISILSHSIYCKNVIILTFSLYKVQKE